MRVTTIDPISGNDVLGTENAPYTIEGSGHDALMIYFESEQNKQAYLDIETKTPSEALVDIYNGTTRFAREM